MNPEKELFSKLDLRFLEVIIGRKTKKYKRLNKIG